MHKVQALYASGSTINWSPEVWEQQRQCLLGGSTSFTMQAAASSITQLPTLQLSIQPGALLCTADALRVYGKVLEIPASASNQVTN